MLTYLITRRDIEEVFAMKDYVSIIEDAFRMLKKVQMPPKVYLTFPKGDLRCMPVYIPSMNIAGVKNVNVHPGNVGLPSVMATITLFDPATGFPVAIMAGTHITNMRTGAAGGVAAKYLSREDSKVAAFIGAGVQAKTQLEALLVVRPISRVAVYDINEEHLKSFTGHAERLGITAEVAGTVEDAVRDADIVTTTTPVRTPVVDWVPEGVHINAIGADAQGKEELNPEILKRATIVIDNWEQASHSGEINVPLRDGVITKEDIYGDIGEIVTREKPGREHRDQITIFDSTGLAIQDISSAAAIFEKLDRDRIEKIEFY